MKPGARRLSFWLVADGVAAAGLLAVALLNSVRLYRGFATSASDEYVYGGLALFFELSKVSFFVGAVKEWLEKRRVLALLFSIFAALFSFFSLTGSTIALLKDASNQGAQATVVASNATDVERELAELPSKIAAQERIRDTYDTKYRDYASVVAGANAELRRLETRRDALRQMRAGAVGSDASATGSGGAFLAIVAPFVADPERRVAVSASLRLCYMAGMGVLIEYGGLFLLAVAQLAQAGVILGAKSALRKTRRYVRPTAQLAVHIVREVNSQGNAVTWCGGVYRSEVLNDAGASPVCLACQNKEATA